ncbi:DUF1931 family protein [Streptomyces sp. NPDC003393]
MAVRAGAKGACRFPVRRREAFVMGVSKFEKFLGTAVCLDAGRNDLKQYGDFVDAKLYDLLVVGQASAKASGGDIVEPWDSSITEGLPFDARDDCTSVVLTRTAAFTDTSRHALGAPSAGPCRPRSETSNASRPCWVSQPLASCNQRLVKGAVL